MDTIIDYETTSDEESDYNSDNNEFKSYKEIKSSIVIWILVV